MSIAARQPLELPIDGRQSETALAVARGAARLLHAHGFCVVSELPLPSGRRADLVALDAGGAVWIVEIKSSVADFRADQKWQDYRAHCDRLFFATTIEVPCEIFPPDTGLIVADAFGAEFRCEAPEHKLPAATRKAMMLLFARAAALRLQSLADPNRALWGRGLTVRQTRLSSPAKAGDPVTTALRNGGCRENWMPRFRGA